MSNIKALSARHAERNRVIEERQAAIANAAPPPSAFTGIDATDLRSILAAASADIMGAVAAKLGAMNDGVVGAPRSTVKNPFGKPASGPVIDGEFKIIDSTGD